VVQSSGNVFADLGLPQAEEKQTKVRLAVALNQIIENSGLSQAAAAKLMDINQPKISALVNYRLDGFSVERLMHFLNALAETWKSFTPEGQTLSGCCRGTPGRHARDMRWPSAYCGNGRKRHANRRLAQAWLQSGGDCPQD
jgi:predicted XRE-type DNA-binding protein